MSLTRVRFARVRNLADGTLDLAPGRTVLVGDNGAGKTSILEAISLVGSLRSFRTRQARVVVSWGSSWMGISALACGERGKTELEYELRLNPRPKRRIRIDGKEVDAATYMSVVAVESLTAADNQLVSGPPAVRRSFLDSVAFRLASDHYRVLASWRSALANLNAALQAERGVSEISAWEEAVSKLAAQVARGRVRALSELKPAFEELSRELLGRDRAARLELLYRLEGEEESLAETYLRLMRASRKEAVAKGSATVGPQRHDLEILYSGVPAKRVLSSGEAQLVASSLKLASARISRPGSGIVLLLDDIDAALSETSLRSVLNLLDPGWQVVAATAKRSMLPLLNPARVIQVHSGRYTLEDDNGG